MGSADMRTRLYDLRRGKLDTDYVGGIVASLNFTRDGQVECNVVTDPLRAE